MPRFKLKYFFISLCGIIILKYFGVFAHFFEKDFYSDFHYPYDGDIAISVEQLRSKEKPDVQPINEYNNSFIYNSSNKCQNMVPRLVYIVKSSVNNFEKRLAIRNTWGYENRFSDVIIRTIFVVGVRNDVNLMKRVKTESMKYNDIIQGDFIDSYYNNTIKTMLSFKWLVTFCPTSKFYMFVDDDIYVSTKNVLRYIRNPTNYPNYLKEPFYNAIDKLSPKRNVLSRNKKSKRQVMNFELPDDVKLFSGYVFISAPHRHKSSKWYVSLEEYSYHMWPPYVTAGSYILSREALHLMYYTSFYTQHFKFDDVYLGLVALKANLDPFHCEEFHFYKKEYDLLGYTYVITSHGYDESNELLKVWNEQRSSGNA